MVMTVYTYKSTYNNITQKEHEILEVKVLEPIKNNQYTKTVLTLIYKGLIYLYHYIYIRIAKQVWMDVIANFTFGCKFLKGY